MTCRPRRRESAVNTVMIIKRICGEPFLPETERTGKGKGSVSVRFTMIIKQGQKADALKLPLFFTSNGNILCTV